MTRSHAVLLLAVVLAGLAFHQNVRWPEHLWDAPAFRTFRFEDLPEVTRFLARPEEKPPVPPSTIVDANPVAATVDKPKEEAKKPEDKPKPVPKKPKAKAPSTKAAEPPKETRPTVLPTTLPQSLTDDFGKCYGYARTSATGVVVVRFRETEDGTISLMGITEDTLGVREVTDCVKRVLSAASLRDPEPPGTELVRETRLTFGTK